MARQISAMGTLAVSTNKVWFALLTAYMASAQVQFVHNVPVVHDKLQLPEAIFTLIVMYAVVTRPKWLLHARSTLLTDAIAAAFLIASIGNYWLIGSSRIGLEALGALYLCSVYYVVSRFLMHVRWAGYKILLWWAKVTIACTVIVGLIVTVLLVLSDYPQIFQRFNSYPYLGDVWRLKGLAKTPNMLMSIVGVAVIVVSYLAEKREKVGWIMVGALICALTLSKSLLVLATVVPGYMLADRWIFVRRQRRLSKLLLGAGGAIAFVTLTMFVVEPQSETSSSNRLFGEAPVVEYGSYSVYGTLYYYLKRTMLHAIPDHWLKGVGIGQFQDRLRDYKTVGVYPEKLINYGPHDSYLGMLVEAGLLGWLLIAVLLYSSGRMVISMRGDSAGELLVVALMAYVLIEASCIDGWNFRQYWYAFATCGFIDWKINNKGPQAKALDTGN